jgi:hypothetical protein
VETAQRIALAIVGVAMVTTLVLPRRQTPQVIGAFGNAFRGSLATAMGTGKRV